MGVHAFCRQASFDVERVDNAMFSVLSKSFKGQTDRREKWHGTDFRVRPTLNSQLLTGGATACGQPT